MGSMSGDGGGSHMRQEPEGLDMTSNNGTTVAESFWLGDRKGSRESVVSFDVATCSSNYSRDFS